MTAVLRGNGYLRAIRQRPNPQRDALDELDLVCGVRCLGFRRPGADTLSRLAPRSHRALDCTALPRRWALLPEATSLAPLSGNDTAVNRHSGLDDTVSRKFTGQPGKKQALAHAEQNSTCADFLSMTMPVPCRRTYALPRSLAIASPMSAGDLTTVMPASLMACILLAAVPSPPEMIAPAWPMRRPGGAV